MTYSEDLLNFYTTNDNYNEIKPLPINLINEYEYEHEIYNFLLLIKDTITQFFFNYRI